ncbi:MAG: signal peptidase I [Bacillota bacterium]
MKKDIDNEINSEKSALESACSGDFQDDDFAFDNLNGSGEIETAEHESDDENDIEDESDNLNDIQNDSDKSGSSKKALKSKLLSCAVFVLTLALAFCGGLIVRNYVFTPVQVAQTSMMNTLSDGDRLYINQLDKGDQFDIVVIDEPLVSNNWLIKRIIATGGQEIEISDGILYITDGGITTEYREEYVYGENIFQSKVYIPEGYIYVLGDHRSVSVDSQDYGVISWEQVVGTAIFIDSEEAVVINSYPAT